MRSNNSGINFNSSDKFTQLWDATRVMMVLLSVGCTSMPTVFVCEVKATIVKVSNHAVAVFKTKKSEK